MKFVFVIQWRQIDHFALSGPATIAFSPNIVRPWLAGRFRTASVDPPTPGRKNANRPSARRSTPDIPPLGLGPAESGAVRKSRPRPISSAPNLAR